MHADPSPDNDTPESGRRPIRRILVIRFSAMGDVLLTFPAVLAIKARWPRARVSFLTDARWAEMLAGSEAIDEVIALDRLGLKRGRLAAFRGLAGAIARLVRDRWDLVVDLQCFSETALLGRLSGAPIRVGRHSKTRAQRLYTHWVETPHAPVYMTVNHLDTLHLAGLLPAGSSVALPHFGVAEAAQREWRQRIDELPQARWIALFVGSAKAEKLWPPAAFVEAARQLRGAMHDLRFLVLGGPDERRLVAEVLEGLQAAGLGDRSLDGGTGSLGALAAAFSDCAATISNDTGPMHLSVAAGTPTLGIFRRPMAHFIPPPPHRHVVAPEGGEMADISVEQVVVEARALLL